MKETAVTKTKRRQRRDYQAYLYILPWLVGFAVLQLYPFLSSFVYSFADYSIGSEASFIGLGNYQKLFTQDKEFWNSLKVTLLFAFYTVPGKLIMALAVAVFLNRDIKGINLIRTLYYIPSLFGGSVAIAILWKLMFLDNGVINAVLSMLHLPSVQWLGDSTACPGQVYSAERTLSATALLRTARRRFWLRRSLTGEPFGGM